MSEFILTPKGKVGISIEAEVINPGIFAGKSRDEVGNLLVWQGPEKLPLSEFFDVQTRNESNTDEISIVIEGDVPRVKRIGQGMKSGNIEINGSTGMHLGAEMVGGSILAKGDAGSWSGMEMKGGLLHITGNAGDHVGCAYRGSWRGVTGGKILIEGNARSQLGGGMVGGEIQVKGNVENFCGIRQSGGLILVEGNAIRGLGAEMTGGIIASLGDIVQFTPGFVEAGAETDPKLGENQLKGRFTKLSGDYAISKNPKGVLYVLG
jgi:formylmethanofuran dehydrogenase subunit C